MTFKTTRRAVLRGLGGVAIGLPLLELTHGRALAQSAPKVAKRFIVFFEHGGTLSTNNYDTRYSGKGEENGVDAWAPASFGETLDPGPIHQVLSNHVSSLLLLRGIDNMAGRRQGSYGGNHYTANCTALTAAHVTPFSADSGTMLNYENGNLKALGPSIDQVLAQRLNVRNPVTFPSVNLEIWGHNYGSPFFRASQQRVGSEASPTAAFNSIFAGVTPSGSTPDPAAIRARALKKSVLDGTSESLRVFKGRMSAQDQQTVEAHLEHIRALELRLAQQSVPTAPACAPPTQVKGLNDASPYPAYGNAQVDIMVAALRCGLTNVCTLNIGDLLTEFLSPPYNTDLGHSLDHALKAVGPTGPEASRYAAWYKTFLDNRRWRMGLMARFLDALKATPEGDGTMLDNSVVLWTSEFSTGGNHSSADVPLLLAGSGGGYFRTGRHLDFNLEAATNPATLKYRTTKSTHNLFTSILNSFGYDDNMFGASDLSATTGPLPGLT